MNQEIWKNLKSASELSPDVHDGSYELVRTIVSAYRDVDEAVLDYHDLNAIYLMCIGTWRHSYDKKHEAVHATHLPEERKQELDHLIDDLRSRAEAGAYKNQEKPSPAQAILECLVLDSIRFRTKQIRNRCVTLSRCAWIFWI